MDWTPRESKREADRLANGDTTGFDADMELKLETEEPQRILPGSGNWAKRGSLAQESQGGRTIFPNRARKEKRRRLEDKLRFKDPHELSSMSR